MAQYVWLRYRGVQIPYKKRCVYDWMIIKVTCKEADHALYKSLDFVFRA